MKLTEVQKLNDIIDKQRQLIKIKDEEINDLQRESELKPDDNRNLHIGIVIAFCFVSYVIGVIMFNEFFN